MTPRYLLAVSHAAHPAGEAERLARQTGLALVFEHPRMLAFANPACGRHSLATCGLVLGTLFWRHGPARPIERLADKDSAQILTDPVGRLLSDLWGGYIGASEAGEVIRVLRDPSGALPCYYAATGSATLVASDVALLLDAGCPKPAVDWLAIGRHHYTAGLPTPDTALAGISELMPGCSLEIDGRGPGDQKIRWSPWDHVPARHEPPGAQIEERLRRMVIHCVLAWSAPHHRLLASVSGGLDSSVVAASLAGPGRDLRCLTLFTDDPAGDERVYARALCAHLGLPLVECHYDLGHVDIDAALSPHLPRPIGRMLGQAYEHAHLAVAREGGVDAFITGSGGDNVFGYSQSAAAIADRWIAEGLGRGLLDTFRDVCRQTGCGPLAALRGSLRARRRGYAWRPAPAFLHPDLCALFGPADLRHPWLEAPPGALPGKLAHVASLLRMHPLLEPGRAAVAPVLYPLISQPLVEACLAIPSWEWRAGGRDRALARRAFAGDLPDLILERRIKGGPDGFTAAILRAHRAEIRERLVEGNLARHGIVDRALLAARLAGTAPLEPAEQTRLLDLLDTEAWTVAWTRRLDGLTERPPSGQAGAASPNG